MALSYYFNNGANALSSIYNGGMNAAVVSNSLETAINYNGELYLTRPITAGEVRDIFRNQESIAFSRQKANELAVNSAEFSINFLAAVATDGGSTIEYIISKFGLRALPYLAEDAMIMSGKYGASLLGETGSQVMSKQQLDQMDAVLKYETPNAIQKYYPDNNGFLGQTQRQFLGKGDLIDRYGGSDYSRFFSPAGTPDVARSLPPGTMGKPLRTFEVLKPFEVEAGTVAPAFNQIGLGTQYRTPVELNTLIDRGIIKEVTP